MLGKRIAAGLLAAALAVCSLALPVSETGVSLRNPILVSAETSGDWEYYIEDSKNTSYSFNSKFAVILGYTGSDKKVSIPSKLGGYSVEHISCAAFSGCTTVEEVTISGSIITTAGYIFAGCTSLKSITVPSTIEYLGSCVFSNCTALESVKILNKYIGSSQFENCTSLKSVELSEAVEEIDMGAFLGCTTLKSITIPKTVKTINEYALGYTYNNTTNKYEKTDNFKIYCYANTAAETYAKENNIDYELISETVKLSTCKISGIKSSYAYTGKAIKPTVTVKNGTTKLTKGTDYTVTYSSNKKTGKAKVVIKGKGNYTGTVTKYFYIVPKKVTSVKATSPKTKQVKVSWKKDTTASGYQIVYATNSKFTKNKKTVNISKNSTVSKTIKSLKKGKTYYVKVRAYKTVNGTKKYGSYSAVKSVKCK